MVNVMLFLLYHNLKTKKDTEQEDCLEEEANTRPGVTDGPVEARGWEGIASCQEKQSNIR